MSQYYEEQIAKTLEMVRRWHGRNAKLLRLTESHATLDILVFEDGQTMMTCNLLISCLEPHTIVAPVNWENNSISIVPSSLEGANIAIIDQSANVEIYAGSFEVRENVKLK